LTTKDLIQVTVNDQRYQSYTKTYQIVIGNRQVKTYLKATAPAPQFTLKIRLQYPGQCEAAHVVVRAANESKNSTRRTMNALVKNCVGEIKQP
jgi:hypothetical protein